LLLLASTLNTQTTLVSTKTLVPSLPSATLHLFWGSVHAMLLMLYCTAGDTRELAIKSMSIMQREPRDRARVSAREGTIESEDRETSRKSEPQMYVCM
jgi:hypothetical protein